jgi:hypothetical protein
MRMGQPTGTMGYMWKCSICEGKKSREMEIVLDKHKKNKMWTEIMTHTSLCISSIFCILKYIQRDKKTTLYSSNTLHTEWHTPYKVLKASTDEVLSHECIETHMNTLKVLHWRMVQTSSKCLHPPFIISIYNKLKNSMSAMLPLWFRHLT